MGFGRRAVVALATTLAVSAPTAPATAQPIASVRRVAGEVSPLGWPFSAFTEAVVDGAGRVVFSANSSAIFARGGGIEQRIGAGDVLPDARRLSGVGAPALTADGCVVARATFEAGGEAVLRACGATRTVLLDAGVTAPGGGAIRAFDARVFAAGTDTVAVAATLEDGTSVLLLRDGGGMHEVARSGGPAPGGGTYAAFRLLGVSDDGFLGFRATVSDGPDGFYVASDTVTRSVAVVGQGTPAGFDFTSIGGGSVHPSGRLAFRAGLSNGQSGVFAADAVGVVTLLRAVALEGDPLLEPAGATIRSFPSSMEPSIDGSGRVAFRALIANATDPPRPSGIFVAAPGIELARVVAVREDISGVGTVSRLRDPIIADDGSVLVPAVIAGGGSGLFVARGGDLTPLAQLGDATSADTGDARFRFGTASVTTSAETAVFLGERDAIFGTDTAGAVVPIAYTGLPSRLGGIMANLGPPTVDATGSVFFGVELQRALYNEVLLVVEDGVVDTFISPDRRLLGGGGIAEFFPTNVDALARPNAAPTGVVFTAALQGAKASEAVFLARSRKRPKALVKVGQRASGQRITGLGTAATGGRNVIALLGEVGEQRNRVILTKAGGKVAAVAVEGGTTKSRAGGKFGELGPPAMGPHGAVFRATIDGTALEGVFVARGRRIGLVAGSGDMTTTGARLRTFTDPIAAGDDVWFLARVAGSVAPPGLYRVRLTGIPGKADAALDIEPVLRPGDAAPATLGGVIVRLDALRVGPTGTVSIIAGIGGGNTSTAILEFANQ